VRQRRGAGRDAERQREHDGQARLAAPECASLVWCDGSWG